MITNEKAGDSKYKVKDHIMFANADGYPVILERCDVNMREVELIPTSNCFTRTSIMKKVGGGFEVRYRYLYEDTDYCYRVKKLGYKNIIDKKTLILHNPSNISRYSTFYMLQRNRIMFVLLNKNILTILFLPVLDVYFFIISFPIKLKLMSANNSTLIKKEKKSTRAVIKASFFYVSSFVAAYAYNIFNIADIITRRKNRGV